MLFASNQWGKKKLLIKVSLYRQTHIQSDSCPTYFIKEN